VNLGNQETLIELNQEEEWNLMTQEEWQELHKDHQTIDVSFKEKISEKLKEELLNRENRGKNEELIPEGKNQETLNDVWIMRSMGEENLEIFGES